MRLVVGLFAMFLTASVAHADEAKGPDPKPEATRAKVPLRVVRMLPETHQALLFDRNRGTHVLAEVGQTVDGYTVDEIDDDEVTLLSAAGKEIVLVAPAEVDSTPRAPKKVVAKAEAAPVDPYGAPPAADGEAPGEAPIDPYADAPIRSVDAPTAISGGEGGVRVASAGPMANPYDDAALPAFVPPGTAKPAAAKAPVSLGGFVPPGTPATAPATRAPAAPAIAPAPTTATPAPAPGATIDPYADAAPPAVSDAPAAPVITPTVLSRSELNVALADFNKLAGVLRGSFTPAGARLDAVAEGSVFAKAGLRNGDVVVSVDNAPLKSIDDAADLYVRAPATRAANVQILRAGKPMTLRVLIQ